MAAYTTDEWKKASRAFFAAHPRCVDCGAPATQRDHVPPRVLLVALGIHSPDDTRWLQARCDSDHARVTQTIDKPLLERWRSGEDPAVIVGEIVRLKRALTR